MNRQELELYYFCTPDIDTIREKYFKTFKELVGVENFFNNANLNNKARSDKQNQLIDKISDFIEEHEKMKNELLEAYHTTDLFVIGALLLQSLVADEIIKSKADIDMFKNKNSILHYKDRYPHNIEDYMYKKKNTMLRYIDYLNDIAGVYEPNIEPLPEDQIKELKDLLKKLDEIMKTDDEDEDDEE